ncbi:tRNA 2-thiouridine(34) synthase MnmA, partial [bacterium]|nr:tRNA 2-thiouridine(34) synthase MnmA [bacterium]
MERKNYLCGVKKKVIVGLSGGVDSSVAAWLLKEQGYEVEGIFMINWHDNRGLLKGDCPFDEDITFAEMVARKLGIKLRTVDLSEEYRKRVVDYMFSEYAAGRTPNPDVLCNREIKFDSFAREALKHGADFIATGHYCRNEHAETAAGRINRLLAGVDRNKDQSYFLCQVSQNQLNNVLFPVGSLTKPEVRKIAMDLGLATAVRKDSQGICFVGKVDLPVFLQQQLEAKKGRIIYVPDGESFRSWPEGLPGHDVTDTELAEMVRPHTLNPGKGVTAGVHSGAHFFTVGQRKGLNLGGYREPLFVIGTDTVNNIIYAGEGQTHGGLYRKGLFIRSAEVHWIRKDLALMNGESRDYQVRIRYRQPLQQACV